MADLPYTSTMQAADHFIIVRGDFERRIGRAFRLASGGVPLDIDRLTPHGPSEPRVLDPHGLSHSTILIAAQDSHGSHQ